MKWAEMETLINFPASTSFRTIHIPISVDFEPSRIILRTPKACRMNQGMFFKNMSIDSKYCYSENNGDGDITCEYFRASYDTDKVILYINNISKTGFDIIYKNEYTWFLFDIVYQILILE